MRTTTNMGATEMLVRDVGISVLFGVYFQKSDGALTIFENIPRRNGVPQAVIRLVRQEWLEVLWVRLRCPPVVFSRHRTPSLGILVGGASCRSDTTERQLRCSSLFCVYSPRRSGGGARAPSATPLSKEL